MAHQGKMSARDLQKMKQNPGLAYATKPASELAMDNRDVWQVRMSFCLLPRRHCTSQEPGLRCVSCCIAITAIVYVQ